MGFIAVAVLGGVYIHTSDDSGKHVSGFLMVIFGAFGTIISAMCVCGTSRSVAKI
jgi:hypothetical protein